MDNEKELIRECIAGNRLMQNRLYTQFAAGMMGTCLRYARNRQDAEEMLQEGFIKVFTHLNQYRFKGTLQGWIKTIIIRCAIEKLRNRQPLYTTTVTEQDVYNISGEELILNGINTKELLTLVQQLPLMCRLVFNLYVFENCKHREIARLLNISVGTSKSNLYDARLLLQQRLHKQQHFLSVNTGA